MRFLDSLTVELSRRSVAWGFASFRKERDTRKRSALVIVPLLLIFRSGHAFNAKGVIRDITILEIADYLNLKSSGFCLQSQTDWTIISVLLNS